MNTALNVWKNPQPGTLAHQREVAASSPEPQPPWERMTHAAFAAWVAAQPGDVPEQVAKHKLLKAVYRLHGLTDTQIGSELASLGTAAQQYEGRIDLQHAPFVRRHSSLVEWLGTRLAKTSGQLDDLFRYAESIA